MENYNKKSIWKWILLYVVIGAIAYGAIYYFFFYNKGGYSYTPQNYQTQTQNNSGNTANYPSITITLPNGGETVEPGEHIKVGWSINSNYPNVRVMVVAGKATDWKEYTTNGSMGTVRGYIIYTGANTGLFDWVVPTEYPGAGNYLIRSEPLTSSEQASGQVYYSDNYFTIK